MYSFPIVLLSGAGEAVSTYTSPAILVADYSIQALSWSTTTGDSNLTVQGTLVNGATAAIGEGDWSTLTVVAAKGQFDVPTYGRYLRVVRPAVDSRSSVIFSGIY